MYPSLWWDHPPAVPTCDHNNPKPYTLLPCISHSVVCLTLSLDSPVRKSQILGFGNTIFSSFLSALTIYSRNTYMHSLGYHMHTQHVHPVYMHLQPTRTIHYTCVSLPLFQKSILSSAWLDLWALSLPSPVHDAGFYCDETAWETQDKIINSMTRESRGPEKVYVRSMLLLPDEQVCICCVQPDEESSRYQDHHHHYYWWTDHGISQPVAHT